VALRRYDHYPGWSVHRQKGPCPAHGPFQLDQPGACLVRNIYIVQYTHL
jgi:hypothetical protein